MKRKTPASYIKDALKKQFPTVKFSCKYESFSMGDSVNVSWTGWPTQKEVESIAKQFQMWTFDWMTDMYEYFDTDKPAEQLAKYVFCERIPAQWEEKEIIKEIEEKSWFNFDKFIESINRDFENVWTKWDAFKCWIKQKLQEIGYTYQEASDKMRIVYNLYYREGLFN